MILKHRDTEVLRFDWVKPFPRANTEKLAILFKTTTRTIARHIKDMKESGELKRIGSDKTGYWQVIGKGN